MSQEIGRLEKENQEMQQQISDIEQSGKEAVKQCPEYLEQEIERLETHYTECKVQNSEDIYQLYMEKEKLDTQLHILTEERESQAILSQEKEAEQLRQQVIQMCPSFLDIDREAYEDYYL